MKVRERGPRSASDLTWDWTLAVAAGSVRAECRQESPAPRSRKPSSHQGSGSNPATQKLPPSRDPALLGRFPMMQYRGEDGSRTRGLSPVIGPTTPDEGWQGEAELIAGRASQLSRRDARKELRPASRWVEGRHPRQEFVISGRGETMWQGRRRTGCGKPRTSTRRGRLEPGRARRISSSWARIGAEGRTPGEEASNLGGRKKGN